MDIQPGYVVRLKIGGPLMNARTVSDRYAVCTWMDDAGSRQMDVYRLSALEVIHDLPPARDEGPQTDWGTLPPDSK